MTKPNLTKHTPEHPHFEVAMIGASCGDYISVTGSFGITVYTDLDGEVIYSNVTEHYEHFGHMVALAQYRAILARKGGAA